jgi:hypothetical protein
MSTKFVVEANVYGKVWVAVEEHMSPGIKPKVAVDAAEAYMIRMGQQTRVRKVVEKMVFLSTKPQAQLAA